ncbi:MAG: TMEM175 family protein [Candidatus Bathyarchaeia archaeon]
MPELEKNEPSRTKLRIEGLSDLVFGLALSIGAIALIQHIPQAPTALVNDVLNFGFSFLIIAVIWLSYTRIVSSLSDETSITLLLKFALLFCVALEPFLYYVYQTTVSAFLDFSSAAYAIDVGAMMVLLSGMTYIVIRQEVQREAHRLTARSIRLFRISMISRAICAAIFLASAFGIFWIQIPIFGNLRFVMWEVALGIFFASRAVTSWTGRKPSL